MKFRKKMPVSDGETTKFKLRSVNPLAVWDKVSFLGLILTLWLCKMLALGEAVWNLCWNSQYYYVLFLKFAIQPKIIEPFQQQICS